MRSNFLDNDQCVIANQYIDEAHIIWVRTHIMIYLDENINLLLFRKHVFFYGV